MKYLSTQLELIPHISKEKFIEIVGYVHNIADLNSDFIEYKSQYISAIHHQNNNILSFSIYDHDWLYEYVYQYDTHIFYFNIETQNLDNDNCMIDIIQYLIDKHFLIENHPYSYDSPLFLNKMNANDFIENIKTQNISLPIIYLNSSWYQKYKNLLYTIVNDFKGIAFVVCCKNMNTDKFIHNEFNLTHGSYYFFSSHDIQKILYRNLNNDEMLSLISRKIKDYVTKIDYDFTVNKVNLNFLQEINENEKTKEEDILLSVEDELHSLKYKTDELSHKIMELENEILALEAENDYLTSSLQVQDKFPVLIKGDEQEFYEGEQKDMVLYLLEQEIKNTVNDSNNDTKMIKSILETNEKIGIRATYLDELKKLLWPMRKLNESSIEKLRKYGIIIRKGPTHYDSKFFDDPRYIIPPASTPSDMYAFHEMFRQIKKWFF